MEKVIDCRQEFSRFMRKLTGDMKYAMYFQDAKKFMKLLMQSAASAAIRPLNKKEWEPLISHAEYMLTKIRFDTRQELKRSVPGCVQLVAFQAGSQDDRRKVLREMIEVAQEIMTDPVRKSSIPPRKHKSDPATA